MHFDSVLEVTRYFQGQHVTLPLQYIFKCSGLNFYPFLFKVFCFIYHNLKNKNETGKA